MDVYTEVTKGGSDRADDNHFGDQLLKLWKFYTSHESVKDSQESTTFAQKEEKEILTYLSNFKGKKVLELGLGIGQFTLKLASTASHVIAADVIAECIDKNKDVTKYADNISFMCADLKKLDFPSGAFDMVFSSCLFMFLSDEETKKLFANVLQWLAPGGYFFIREPCYHRWGNVKAENDMPIYRTALEYSSILESTTSFKNATFKIIRGKNLLTYIQYHSNPTQVCFLAKRIDGEESEKHVQLIHAYYSSTTIEQFERIYGQYWFSPEGEAISRDLCMELGLRPGQRVLDVGSGMGGSAFFLARHYGVHVHGIDLSSTMFNAAVENQDKLEGRVKKLLQFELNDVLEADFEEESFDYIYSRDVIVHVPDKPKLFSNIYRWLKPGGILIFTDFCSGPSPPSQEFLQFLNMRSLLLKTMDVNTEEMKSAGFSDVTSLEISDKYLSSYQKTLEFFLSTRESFIKDYSEGKFNEVVSSLQVKIDGTESGQLKFGTFKGRK